MVFIDSGLVRSLKMSMLMYQFWMKADIYRQKVIYKSSRNTSFSGKIRFVVLVLPCDSPDRMRCLLPTTECPWFL